MQIEDRVFIVTGASSGIGLATAVALSGRGAKVALLARSTDALERLARQLPGSLPVTVDMEAGYGTTPEAVADAVRAVIAAGAVGINLEDGLHASATLRALGAAVERLRAAVDAAAVAGVPIVINARTDTYLLKYGASDGERFEETVRRAKAYLAAGADCIYPIGLGDAATLAALVKTLDAPINVAARPGVPGVTELARLGVARVSTATRFATLALSAVESAARELRASGRFECLDAELTHPDVQRLFGEG